MTEGTEDPNVMLAVPPGSVPSNVSNEDAEHATDQKPEEPGAGAEENEVGSEGEAEGGAGGDGEEEEGDREWTMGICSLSSTCCVCIEMEQIHSCLRSEKICILPILACLLSLALCTAGLKWVFVDKIFEYEPPTHSDPKRIEQGPIIISADPTLGLPVSFPHLLSSAPPLANTIRTTTAGQEFTVRARPSGSLVSTKVLQGNSSTALTYRADEPTASKAPKPDKQIPVKHNAVEFNDIIISTSASVSTTPAAKTSSHVMRCSDSQKNYCVNGGECFTLEVIPGSTKFLCRCPNEFTGDRCQNYVMASFYKNLGIELMEAEELYQKRVITISGICIALLVVGIMCVVAYCKTKKQRKKFHDRLRQSLQKERNNMAANRPEVSNHPLQNVQPMTQPTSNIANSAQHVTEKETEMLFSSQFASSAVTLSKSLSLLSLSWSENVLSENPLVLEVPSSAKKHRGRLNALGHVKDLSAYMEKSQDTSNIYHDLQHSKSRNHRIASF
ncbi:pro-neuregulin-1, membrane-bound isoform-like [Gadus chalcogrammus]|uniref:pro-neuregulin-1, membrane-bound isoform-like n=1 Tax=Gadus chalcogrammus TaxID=1042646 RepID=UPI0024C2B3DC|nr:pro-neuregulin-1, membrane-bound isoform-like [Gadus chalcogrammus]